MSYLDHWCPECAALPGEVCFSRWGYQADRPHKARILSRLVEPPADRAGWAEAERVKRKFPTPESRAVAEQNAGRHALEKAADFLDDGFHEKLVDELRDIAASIGSLNQVERKPLNLGHSISTGTAR